MYPQERRSAHVRRSAWTLSLPRASANVSACSSPRLVRSTRLPLVAAAGVGAAVRVPRLQAMVCRASGTTRRQRVGSLLKANLRSRRPHRMLQVRMVRSRRWGVV